MNALDGLLDPNATSKNGIIIFNTDRKELVVYNSSTAATGFFIPFLNAVNLGVVGIKANWGAGNVARSSLISAAADGVTSCPISPFDSDSGVGGVQLPINGANENIANFTFSSLDLTTASVNATTGVIKPLQDKDGARAEILVTHTSSGLTRTYIFDIISRTYLNNDTGSKIITGTSFSSAGVYSFLSEMFGAGGGAFNSVTFANIVAQGTISAINYTVGAGGLGTSSTSANDGGFSLVSSKYLGIVGSTIRAWGGNGGADSDLSPIFGGVGGTCSGTAALTAINACNNGGNGSQGGGGKGGNAGAGVSGFAAGVGGNNQNGGTFNENNGGAFGGGGAISTSSIYRGGNGGNGAVRLTLTCP